MTWDFPEFKIFILAINPLMLTYTIRPKLSWLAPLLLHHSSNILILLQDIRHWPQRRDGKWIDLRMTSSIMSLDLRKLRGILERWHIPIKVPHPAMKMRISAPDIPQITLEVLYVDDVKADDGGEKTDIGFGDGFAKVVFVAGGVHGCKVLLGAIERGEEGCHGGLVG